MVHKTYRRFRKLTLEVSDCRKLEKEMLADDEVVPQYFPHTLRLVIVLILRFCVGINQNVF